ncbi:hypothetical protein FHS18_000025 [Paenibacillus phyllosphaerae]|uniref:Uncharacterized protein n=1 Tax=Paenibacillus phyllosphaerae TaxID=274593 RepID=A0A7W5FKK3_9BACL|nr:hypothetical protein [Paenibacillus phyllosphaerae]
MDAMAIYLFFFGMLALLAVGLLVPAHYITIPEDDGNEVK